MSNIEKNTVAFRMGYSQVFNSGCFAAVAIAEYSGDQLDAYAAGANLAERESLRHKEAHAQE